MIGQELVKGCFMHNQNAPVNTYDRYSLMHKLAFLYVYDSNSTLFELNYSYPKSVKELSKIWNWGKVLYMV